MCSAGPVRSKVLQTSNRAGISNGLERIRSDSKGEERGKERENNGTQSYFALRFLFNITAPRPRSKRVFALLRMTPEPRWIQGRQEGVPGRGEPPAVQGAKNLDSCSRKG